MRPSRAPRALLLLPVIALGAALLATPGAAHPDIHVATGSYPLSGGELLEFPVELHYHRLVGHVTALTTDAQDLRVRVEGPGATDIAGPGPDLTLNEVVRCCKGDVWTPHTILIRNDGPMDVEIDVRIVLLHDGIAVMGENAEPGAVASTALWFVAFSLFFGHRLRKGRLHDPRGPRRWAISAGALHIAQWAIAALLGLAGMLRYGGGPAAGTLAITADLPWTNNQILTTHSLLIGSLVIAWAVMAGMWTAAARRTGSPHARVVGIVGILIGLGSLAAILAAGLEYGYFLAFLILAVAAAALPLTGGIVVLRRAG